MQTCPNAQARNILKVSTTILICVFIQSCVVVPLPTEDADEYQGEILKIEVGESQKSEVKAILGEPTIIWEKERVWVYEKGPSGRFLIIIAGRGGPPAGGVIDLGESVILLQFDEKNKVSRVERGTAPIRDKDYGKFLQNWVKEEHKS